LKSGHLREKILKQFSKNENADLGKFCLERRQDPPSQISKKEEDSYKGLMLIIKSKKVM